MSRFKHDCKFNQNIFRNTMLWFVPALLMLVAYPAAVMSQDSLIKITRIEEDWSVLIGTPDASDEAPQIITVVSPTGSVSGNHFVFELNHATQPEYAAGGMQLQSWYGEEVKEFRNFPKYGLLRSIGEEITFTVSMSLDGSNLHVEIQDGDSSTWGAFGGTGYLKITQATDLNTLRGYDLNTSIKNSRIGFASHRVQNFVRKEVRFYTQHGLMATDLADRVVYQHSEQ